ncbi:hypothetical protein HMPREF9278_1109 [Mobiluncus mulieris FB024-16]|nr:hypothetical protein HMPREF9278_1109 [Mobiluncus mulieris FB024-16]
MVVTGGGGAWKPVFVWTNGGWGKLPTRILGGLGYPVTWGFTL